MATNIAMIVHADSTSVDTQKLQGIPNFAVFRNGALAHQQAGAMRAPQLVQLVA